jgi:hypothetical protein
MKRILTVVALALVAGLTACSLVGDQTYSSHGMNITMGRGFKETSQVAYTVTWEGSDSMVIALKEEVATLEPLGVTMDSPISDYLELVKANAMLDSPIATAGDLTYFTYEKTVENQDFYYLAVGLKAPDAFWLVQFAGLQSNKDKLTERFLGWAGTITFDDV